MWEEEQRWRDGEQEGEGRSSPRCRIETALNPDRTQTKEKGRHENRDYSTKEAMWRWETGRVGNEKGRKFLVAVDGEGLGKELGRVEEGAEIRKNKHALGYPITQSIIYYEVMSNMHKLIIISIVVVSTISSRYISVNMGRKTKSNIV